MRDPFSLEGRAAVVTGASRGLGYAIARALGVAGATVAVNGRDPGRAEAACASLKRDGVDARPLPFDVADGEAGPAAIEDFRRDLGRLDVFVHNAGHGARVPFLDHGFDDWRRILDVHLSAGFRLAQAAARPMVRAGGGRILFTSSIMASVGRATVPAYAAAKGGVNALVRSMAAELGPSGVTVNAIAPGYVVTDLTRDLHESDFDDVVRRRTPVGRWGEADEIGWAALYLASDAAAYVNGHVLTVDGGMTIALNG